MKSYYAILGYVLVGFLTYLAIAKGTNNPQLFLNIHGIGIVCGGLVVAAMASFPGPTLMQTIQSVFKSIRSNGTVNPQTANEVVKLASAYRRGMNAFERELETIRSPELKDAGNLVLEGIKGETLDDILERRIDEVRNAIQLESTVCLTLSKYSPALGLAATVLGLVDILSQLADNDMGKLGSGMAVALSGTFYGIFMSNLVFAPLAELISSAGDATVREREMVREGVLTFLAGQDPLVVGELMNSYLKSNDRIDFTKLDLGTGRNAESRAS